MMIPRLSSSSSIFQLGSNSLIGFLLLPSAIAIFLSHEAAIKYPEDNFIVTCKDESGRAVTWSGPRGPLGAKSNPKVETASYGTSIFFMRVNREDAGVYTCSAGHDKKTFELTVKAPIKFMDTAPEQTGKEFQDITLRCEVQGGDKPIVTWSGENGNLEPPKFETIADGLLIRNVSRIDERTYICKAMQPSTGDIREQRIKLKVEHKPNWKVETAREEPVYGFKGSTVNLTCEVDAVPHPKFEWKGKKFLSTSGQIYNETHKSTLSLNIQSSAVFGMYICRVHNKHGQIERVFKLQEGVQPDPPDYIILRGANQNLLAIGIHGPIYDSAISETMKTQGYRVEYRQKDLEPTVEDEMTGTVEWNALDFDLAEDNNYPIRHLQHDTEYEVRASTRNLAGISEFTNISYFRTLQSEENSGFRMESTSSIFRLLVIMVITPMILMVLVRY